MHRPEVSVWVPRYGTVRSLVLYGLFAAVVWRADAAVRETMAAVGGPGPRTVGQGLAVGLWLLLAGVLAYEYRRQTRPHPSFLTAHVRQHYLHQRVPARVKFGTYVALLVAGGYVATFARATFFARLDDGLLVVRRLLTAGDPGAFSLVNLGYGVLFVAGALAFSHAADRVLIAGARAVLARWGR